MNTAHWAQQRKTAYYYKSVSLIACVSRKLRHFSMTPQAVKPRSRVFTWVLLINVVVSWAVEGLLLTIKIYSKVHAFLLPAWEEDKK
jgi:hypothetical protein